MDDLLLFLIQNEEKLDTEFMDWIKEAYYFSLAK
jgi:hypothetical protein